MSERIRLVLAVIVVGLIGSAGFVLNRARSAPPEELAAAAEALAAWGRWAGDGDLSHLDATFADGPQLAQIRREDAALVPGEWYEFYLEAGRVIAPGVVRGTVILSREGEPEQRFDWDIELVEVDGVWRLWTVRTADG